MLIVGIMKEKHITITEEQEEWIQDHYLNLSRFVQDKLDELMEDEG